MDSYVAYHVHTMYSLLDSCTSYKDYVDKAVKLGQKAIAFSEHGKPLNWVEKKKYCDESNIKYLHAVEIYITEQLEPKVRDNMHTVLIARNYEGVKEINSIVSKSCEPSHFYYTNRISIDEFLNLSSNVITTSACLASPLNKLSPSHPKYLDLVKRYDYLEIQPHLNSEQIAFNVHLAELSEKYNKPLIAGTDAHSVDSYKAECRKLLLKRKHKSYGDEDTFDLTYKSYDELVSAFREQNAIPEELWLKAIENTNVMADSVEEFELDTSNKYPILYGSKEKDSEKLKELIKEKFEYKVKNGIIPECQVENFKSALKEEVEVFEKIEMSGFMLSQAEFNGWCVENNIPIGFARGSVGGSRVAYVTDIIDLNPETWGTVFSRFCNADRVEPGDIDTDLRECDRPKVFQYIINRFGTEKTARVASYGTIQEAGAIEDICGGLRVIWNEQNGLKENESTPENPYNLKQMDKVKELYKKDPDSAKAHYPDIFYYFDGLVGTTVSQSVHPAGLVVSPINLREAYGAFDKDGEYCLMLDMDNAHEAGLIKYDFLVLNTINIIADACEYAGIPYPKSHEINWDDENVWVDMLKTNISVFQFESEYSAQLLKKFKPRSIFDMSLINAAIRPSGASYRDDLMNRKIHKNPSSLIDDILKDSYGYLVYQEQQIKFLQEACGLSGSAADTIRRAIGKKNEEVINAALPKILNGYCAKSDKPRGEAEKEAQEFLQVLSDSASYSFGYNHSIAYCLLGYVCAYLRYYHPHEFITSYLNNAANPDDITNGTILAEEYGIRVTSPRWGFSKEDYVFDKEANIIAKGLSSVKFFNKKVSTELYDLARSGRKFENFVDVLFAIKETSINSRQLDILLRIGFFSDFGNCAELIRITDIFRKYKDGEAKQVKCDSLADREREILERYASNKNAKGDELKSYTINDMYGLMVAFEQKIRSLHIEELPIKTRIQNSMEYLGYVDITTGKPEDRRKLIVDDYNELFNKNSGKRWCARIGTTSVGTGKKCRLTVRDSALNKTAISKGDIIYADEVFKNQAGYWELPKYHLIY